MTERDPNEAAQRMRQTFEATGDRWFKIAADQLEAAAWARTRLEDFADKANAGEIHYSARELKRRVWSAFADFDAARADGEYAPERNEVNDCVALGITPPGVDTDR